MPSFTVCLSNAFHSPMHSAVSYLLEIIDPSDGSTTLSQRHTLVYIVAPPSGCMVYDR